MHHRRNQHDPAANPHQPNHDSSRHSHQQNPHDQHAARPSFLTQSRFFALTLATRHRSGNPAHRKQPVTYASSPALALFCEPAILIVQHFRRASYFHLNFFNERGAITFRCLPTASQSSSKAHNLKSELSDAVTSVFPWPCALPKPA